MKDLAFMEGKTGSSAKKKGTSRTLSISSMKGLPFSENCAGDLPQRGGAIFNGYTKPFLRINYLY